VARRSTSSTSIRPGEKIDVPKVHTLEPGKLDAWKPEELALMIDEA